jgi:hypothetical protein
LNVLPDRGESADQPQAAIIAAGIAADKEMRALSAPNPDLRWPSVA